MKKLLAAVVVIALGVGLLGFTAPGHRLLNAVGFATACDSGSSNC